MRNIRLLIEYEGTNYAGWQRQNPRRGDLASTRGPKTIQQTLEDAIEQITREKVVLYGAGRTDAGVHAMGQVAHFKTASEIFTTKLPSAINAHLPYDIAVKSAEEVPDTFHAQYDAKSKVYRYTVLNEPLRCVLFRNFCYHFPFSLDINKMKEASQFLLGAHDFRTFQTHVTPKASTQSDVRQSVWRTDSLGRTYTKKSSVRTMSVIEIKKENGFIHFLLEADGFLYNMARAIVGTLLEVGRGKITPNEFKRILEAKNRRLAGETVPAKGLCLMEIKY